LRTNGAGNGKALLPEMQSYASRGAKTTTGKAKDA